MDTEKDYRNVAIQDRPLLDDVLEWFVIEEEHVSAARTRLWMSRFPYYRTEIAEFAASWFCLDVFPAENTIRALEADEILLMYTSKVDELLRESGH